MATPIATVSEISGNVFVRALDGSLKLLNLGDTLIAGETIVTENGASVVLDFGNNEQVAFGDNQSVLLNEQLLFGYESTPIENEVSDPSVDTVLSVLEGDGDLLDELEAPAAGTEGAPDGGGSSFVRLTRITESVDPLAFSFDQNLTDTFNQEPITVVATTPNQNVNVGVDVDTVIPSVEVIIAEDDLASGETSDVVFQFSEAVQGFDEDSLTLSNGKISNLLVDPSDPTRYTAIFTPTENIEGDNGLGTPGSVSVNAGSYTNIAGNAGSSGQDSVQIDTQLPRVEVSYDAETLYAGQTSKVTFTFSEPVAGFDANTLNVSGGKLNGLQQDSNNPTVFTAIFTPDPEVNGSGSVTVIEGSYTDLFGNLGLKGADQLNVLTDAPTLEITPDEVNQVIGEVQEVTFQFSRAVKNFEPGDIFLTGGTLSNFQQQADDRWTADFTANGEASITITVADNSYTDLGDNPGSGNKVFWNTVPLADDKSAITVIDRPIIIDVLNNDKDPDVGQIGRLDELTITEINGISISASETVWVAGGGVTLIGSGNDAGKLQFTPEDGVDFASFNGQAVFDYTVTDGQGGSDQASVTIGVIDVTVTDDKSPAGVNQGNGDEVLASIDDLQNVQINGQIPASGSITSLIVSDSQHNSVTVSDVNIVINSDGTFTALVNVTTLQDGDLRVSLSAQDQAGNSAETTDTIFKDTVTEVVLTAIEADTQGNYSVISGTGEPDSLVTLVQVDGLGNEVAITGAESLEVDGDGNWSFDPISPLNAELFEIRAKITDRYGNTNQDTRFVPGLDLDQASITVSEQGIVGLGNQSPGTNASNEEKRVDTGTLRLSLDSDESLEGLEIAGQAINLNDPSGVIISTTYGNIHISSIAVDGNDLLVNFDYTLLRSVDHSTSSDDSYIDSIPVKVVDSNGDIRNGNLSITIEDDAPIAEDMTAIQVIEESGHTFAGTDLLSNDNLGADGAILHKVYFTDRDGNPDQVTIGKAIDVGNASVQQQTLQTQYGELTVSSDGRWSYTPLKTLDHAGADHVREIFQYDLIDADGSVSDQATKQIDIFDTEPDIVSADDAVVLEANLLSGTAPNEAALTVTGDVELSANDPFLVSFAVLNSADSLYGLDGLASSGLPVFYQVSVDGSTLIASTDNTFGNDSARVFTVVLTDRVQSLEDALAGNAPSPGYDFTLLKPIDHPGGTVNIDLPFDFVVQEQGGDATQYTNDKDSDEGRFTVTIVDDVIEDGVQNLELNEDGSKTLLTPAEAIGSTITLTTTAVFGEITIDAATGAITYTPNENYSGSDSFTYEYNRGDGEVRSVTVSVSVLPVADMPEFTVAAGDVLTNEDESIALGLKAPMVTDDTQETGASNEDFPERLGEILLTGIPEGASLLDGENGDLALLVSDGSPIAVVLSDGPTHLNSMTGQLTLSVAQFEALKILPPSHDASNFQVNASVKSYEVDSNGDPRVGIDPAETMTQVDVNVVAVTDSVSLEINGAKEASFSLDEDVRFDLTSALSASFEDLDGSEQRELIIEGLPEGSRVSVDGVNTVIGHDGRISVNAPGLSSSVTGFPDIRLTPPKNVSGDIIGIKVTLRAEDTDGDTHLNHFNGNPGVQTSDVTLDLYVNPIAGDVIVTDVSTPEDRPVNFLSGVKVTDTDTGNEVIDSLVFDIPMGWSLVEPAITNGAVWSSTQMGDTYSVIFTGGTQEEREEILNAYMLSPPAHSSLDAHIVLTVTTTDTQMVNGVIQTSTVTSDKDLTIQVSPVAEQVLTDSNADGNEDLTLPGDYVFERDGQEDTWFIIGTENDFDFADNWNNEDGNEQIFALLTPEIVSGNSQQTSAVGAKFKYVDDHGNTVIKAYNGQAVEVPVEFLDTLAFMAPENIAGKFDIKVQAKTLDFDDDYLSDPSLSVTAMSGEFTLANVLIKPVADTVTNAVSSNISGPEGTPLPLSIRPSSSDSSETFNVTLGNIPEGAVIQYNGTDIETGSVNLPEGITVTSNQDGTWSIEIVDFDPSVGGQMSITPPPGDNSPFELAVSTVSVDTLTVDGETYTSISFPNNLSVSVSPKGVADGIDEVNGITIVAAEDQSNHEESLDNVGGLFLNQLVTNITLIDADGSETLGFKISGLPDGFSVQGGVSLGKGEWAFSSDQFNTVKLLTPENFSGTEHLTLSVITTENDGDSRTQDFDIPISVTPSPEASINLSMTAPEDVRTLLDFSVEHQNSDLDEFISSVWIKASDFDPNSADINLYLGKEGDTLADSLSSDGITLEGGWYKLTQEAFNDIWIQGKTNWSGNGSFTVKYEVTDPGNDTSVDPVTKLSEEKDYLYEVIPVTDQPYVNISGEDEFTLAQASDVTFTLSLGNHDLDYDGSEELTRILLDNVPEGVIVEGAEFIGNHQWLMMTTENINGPLEKPITLNVKPLAGGLNNHQINITISTEDDSHSQPLTATTTISLTTDFTGEGGEDPAEILSWEQTTFAPTEDVSFNLSSAIHGAIEDGVTDNAFTITLTDLPEGTQVFGMIATQVDGKTVWTASSQGGNAELQTLLNTIQVSPPENWNMNHGTFDYTAQLSTYVPSGRTEEQDVAMNQVVSPVSDPVEILITVQDSEEGQPVSIDIDMSNPADDPNWTLVDGKLYLQVDSGGLTGELSQGTQPLNQETVTGVSGVSDGDYYVVDVADQNQTVSLSWQPDDTNAKGLINVNAWAQTQETDSSMIATGNDSSSGSFIPVNNGYDFEVMPVIGAENALQKIAADLSNLIQIPITDKGLVDSNEVVGSIVLQGVPNGFLVFVGDNAHSVQEVSLSKNAGGDGNTNSWLLGNGQIPGYIAILPPQFWSGTINDLVMTVTSGEQGLEPSVTERTFSLEVAPVANGVTLNPTSSFGQEGDIITLNLNPNLVDMGSSLVTDQSSERLTLELKGLGANAALFVGDELVSSSPQVSYDETTDTYRISDLTSVDVEGLGFVQANTAMDHLEVRAQSYEQSAPSDPSNWTEWQSVSVNINEQVATTGNDLLLYTGQLINGLAGDDVIQLRFGEQVAGNELAANLRNIEQIDLSIAGENKIETLTVDDVLSMTDNDNLLTLLGDHEDTVQLSADWSFVSTDEGFAVYTNEDKLTTLKIQENIQIE